MANLLALSIVLDNLKESVRYNLDLIGGIRHKVEELCRVLNQLKDCTTNPEWQNKSDFRENLVNEIREVVYQAENAIETYIVRASKLKNRSVLLKAFHAATYVSDLRSLGRQIDEASERLENIYQNDLRLNSLIARPEFEAKKKETFMVAGDSIVGFEDSANEVIKLLTRKSESDQLQVISIIGMPGLGKTTLARKVFNDPEIEYEFYFRVFLYISQEYKTKEVFLKILTAVTQVTPEMNEMSDGQLAEVIHQKLHTTKYLIVMDDVWTEHAWNDLKFAFPNNKKGSRVLITSQHASVAHHANANIGPYYLRFFNREESRELLRRKVFGENIVPQELKRYESEILDKCSGLPLGIVVVAGILRNHREMTNWWERVAKNVGLNQGQSEDRIRRSYNHLPYCLKPCFLYLGVFPEDLDIPVCKLLRLWIAEGFIQQDGFMNLEDTAEAYLTELVDRSLLMIRQRRANGQIKTCYMNNILRNFCKNEAMKENLFQEIKSSDEATSPPNSSFNHRRLCINSHVLDYIRSIPSSDSEHVRSFLSFAKDETTLNPEHVSTIPKALTLLRVLDARSVRFSRFPIDLIHLVLLKYIAISGNFKVLPEKMCNLQNLQTFIIGTTSPTLEIKADIWKMAQLRHLHSNCSTFLPKGKEEDLISGNLQTLCTIAPESCRREVFERSPKLRKLGVRGKLASIITKRGESNLFDSLVKLNFLQNLKLLNEDINSNSKLHSLPPENMFPRKLTSLTLQNTSLDWRHMSTLGKLDNLEVLKLKENAFVGPLWETEDGGFRRLTVLHISRTDLMLWKTSGSNFPVLRSLFIRHCRKLEGIPFSLGDVPSLQLIDLNCSSPGVASSARKISMLKLRLQAQQNGSSVSTFKLCVYPPDH